MAIYDKNNHQVGWLRNRESPLMSYVLSRAGDDLLIIATASGDSKNCSKMEVQVVFYNITDTKKMERRSEVTSIVWQAYC